MSNKKDPMTRFAENKQSNYFLYDLKFKNVPSLQEMEKINYLLSSNKMVDLKKLNTEYSNYLSTLDSAVLSIANGKHNKEILFYFNLLLARWKENKHICKYTLESIKEAYNKRDKVSFEANALDRCPFNKVFGIDVSSISEMPKNIRRKNQSFLELSKQQFIYVSIEKHSKGDRIPIKNNLGFHTYTPYENYYVVKYGTNYGGYLKSENIYYHTFEINADKSVVLNKPKNKADTLDWIVLVTLETILPKEKSKRHW